MPQLKLGMFMLSSDVHAQIRSDVRMTSVN